jgi:hypothetical protein
MQVRLLISFVLASLLLTTLGSGSVAQQPPQER